MAHFRVSMAIQSMAIGIKKIVVDALQPAQAVIDYLANPQNRGDYYSEGGQAVLGWIATERIKKEFSIRKPWVESLATLHALLEGRHPVTGHQIRRWGNAIKNRGTEAEAVERTMVAAHDVTLSPAPKGVSILWALAPKETRQKIERMVWHSAIYAIAELMRKPLVRQRYGPGPADIRNVAMADILGVSTLHTTARVSERGAGIPDPQLHVHSLLLFALDEESKARALDSRAIHMAQKEIDAFASATLAEWFRVEGYEIERRVDQRGAVSWELAGIPKSLIKEMSTRRAEVEELRRFYEASFQKTAEGAAWERFLEKHRGPKANLAGPALRDAWDDQGVAHDFARPEARAYAAAANARAQAGPEKRDEHGAAAEQFRKDFLANVCGENALVPKSRVDEAMFEAAKGLIDPLVALSIVGEMYRSGDLLVAPDGRVTTLEVVAQEQRARKAAQQLLESEPAPAAAAALVESELRRAAESGRPLDEHQTAATMLAVSGRRLVSITGKAGTGKGVAAGVFTPIWQAQGRRVYALAVAGRTAQQLGADAKTELAKTIDGFLAGIEHGRRQLQPSDVLLVDEAAMVDHYRYAPLLEVAAAAGATFVQIGDDKQLSPVKAGGLWTLIHAAAEAHGATAALETVRRARDPREAQAWTDVREGRTAEALAHWHRVGRLRLYDSRPEMLAGMVREWWVDGHGQGLIAVDTSNAERDVLNQLAQAERLAAGELGAETMKLANGREIRQGDQVLFSAFHELPGLARVENGTTATVAAVGNHEVQLLLHEAAGERMVRVLADAPVELGYARHIQKGQGMTVEGVTNWGMSRRTDRNLAYTMSSRGRGGAQMHAVRSEVATSLGLPGLGPVTEAQRRFLSHQGVQELPENWTWADASIELEARQGQPLGTWAHRHLVETMGMEPALSAHVVVEALARREADQLQAVPLDQVAESVRQAVIGRQAETAAPIEVGTPIEAQEPAAPQAEAPDSELQALLTEIEAAKQAYETRDALARQLAREGTKEAIGDKPLAVDELEAASLDTRREVGGATRTGLAPTWDEVLAHAQYEPEPQLAEMPEPGPESDVPALRMFNETQLRPGQVVSFAVALPLREPFGVEQGELALVRSVHRGGLTHDYAEVELVGGRKLKVYQPDPVQPAPAEIGPEAVTHQQPRLDQRDPYSLSTMPLMNGVILQRGDLVRYAEAAPKIEAGAQGRIVDIDRHPGNRAFLRLDADGRQVTITPGAPLEIVEPAPYHPAPATPAPDRLEADQPLPVQAETEPTPALLVEPGAELEMPGQPIPPPLPAREPLETVARQEAAKSPQRALAHYEALGQLYLAERPEREAARLWIGDPATIVVQDPEQAQRVRQAVDQQRAEEAKVRQRPQQPDLPEPRIVLAEQAHQERAQRLQEGEPALIARAYVVVPEYTDRTALVRSLSTADESHLITRAPTSERQLDAIYGLAEDIYQQRLEAADTALQERTEQLRRHVAERDEQLRREALRTPIPGAEPQIEIEGGPQL